jgi:hypothetical protein
MDDNDHANCRSESTVRHLSLYPPVLNVRDDKLWTQLHSTSDNGTVRYNPSELRNAAL